MKLTEAKLKKLILEALNEAYELTAADKKKRKELEGDLDQTMNTRNHDDYESSDILNADSKHPSADVRRAYGLQDPEEVEQERQDLTDYRNKLESTEGGKRLIRAFMTGGGITAAHAIGFRPASGQKHDDIESSPFRTWIRKYGLSPKGSLSTSAWLGDPKDIEKIEPSNTLYQEWAESGIGFIVTGYPILAGRGDLMSQIHGVLPRGLVDMQKSSGVAKRGDTKLGITTFLELEYAPEDKAWIPEAIVGNPKIVGAYVSKDSLHSLGQESVVALKKEAESLGLRFYILPTQYFYDED